MRLNPLTTARWARTTLSVVALASLTACASFSGIFSHATPITPEAVGVSSTKLATNSPALDAQWWKSFGDYQLNSLVDEALANNPSLRAAQARLQKVEAGIANAEAARMPQVNASFDATQQRYSKNGLIPAPLAGSIKDSGSLQASGSWELDLFGKNRAALEAAIGQARAANADAQAARMMLATQVARTYFQWVRIQNQLAVAQRALAQREQSRKLVQDRYQAGLDTQVEVQQSESALPDARYQIEALKEQQALLVNALTALTSKQNSTLALVKPAPAAIKIEAIAQSIPMDLLGRRADITAARWRVEAATHDIDNAKALFYPNVNLTAFAGFSSIGLDRLLDTGSNQWGVGPAIRLPMFEGGRLRANLKAKSADLDAAIETYNSVVLDAVRDVADQLTSSKAIVAQQTEQQAAQSAAENAYSIALQRYEGGLGNYLQVLNAETSVLAQRRLGVDLAARATDTRVQLIRALGGGFQDTDESHALAVAQPR